MGAQNLTAKFITPIFFAYISDLFLIIQLMRFLKIALILCLILTQSVSFAQYFSTGDDPGSIRWRELRTENFQLIYPEEYEEKAQSVAHIFEKVYEYGYHSLKHAPRKISIILHTHAVKSNGLVAWSPKRMELFPTPNQTLYAQDWIEQLAIHEFRHVVQMDKIQDNMPGILNAIFGEQAAAVVVGAYLPFWFLEGDAVMAETSLSQTGRGRLPSFLMENKALAVEKGLPSYDKITMGSYKDFVPNRYRFGYWFTSGIRQKYGSEVWSDVLTKIGEKPLSINPLNSVLKETTGSKKESLYAEIFKNYLKDWESEIASLPKTNHKPVSLENNIYSNYKYISALSDSSVISYKESRRDIGRIVQAVNGEESTIYTPGNVADESFSQNGNLLIWAENRPDIRWTHADRSVVVVYDLNKKKKKIIQSENTLFSPVISIDSEVFAAVEIDHLNNYYLSVFDLESGDLIKQFETDENDYFFTPCWNENGETLYFIGLNAEGKYIGSLNTKDGEFSKLTSSNYFDIRNPEFHEDKLYYTSSKTGIDNIFSIDVITGEDTQLTSVAFGADYASVADSSLFFSNYSSSGYKISALRLSDALGRSNDEIETETFELAETLASHEKGLINFEITDSTQYKTKPYRKLAHLFNFHSWAPAYINANDYEVRPGVSFMSQNKLGTASTNLGYEYDLTEEVGKYKVDFEYSGLFPIINTKVAFGKRKSKYYQVINNVDRFGSVISRDTTLQDYSYNQFELELDMRIPLYFNQGKYSQILQPEIRYSYTKLSHNTTTPNGLSLGYYHSMLYRIYFHNRIRQSELDIIPKWGQVIDLLYQNSPTGGLDVGDLKALQSYLYFPGMLHNHGIKIYNGYQTKSTDADISFSDAIKYPRGYNSSPSNEMYSFSIDYVLPVGYPDLSLGKIFYLKRLRTSLFYDYADQNGVIYNGSGSAGLSYSRKLNSFGAELTGDGHFLRIVAPVSVGIRGAYLPDYQEFNFEFLFSINFDSI